MWVSRNIIFLSLFIFLSAVGIVIYLISFQPINTNVSYPSIDSTNSLSDPIMKKVIWIFWEKGWQTAPYLPQKVLLSWKFHNPDWHIEELTMDRLSDFVDLARLKHTMTIQAKSDMIRLMILSKYGGVWVDASLLCLQPLDNWIWAVLPRNGFWMYSRECSWFMIAASNSFIAQAWLDAAIKYWEIREEPSGEVGGVSNYRWMDGTLKDARANNKSLDAKVSAMLFISCGSLCGPSTFYLRDCMYEVNMPLHEDIRKCFDETPPYVVKLTVHGRCGLPPVGPQNMKLTNGIYAILASFGNVSMAVSGRQPLSIFDTSNLMGSLRKIAPPTTNNVSSIKFKSKPLDFDGSIVALKALARDIDHYEETRTFGCNMMENNLCDVPRSSEQCVAISYSTSTGVKFETELEKQTGCTVYLLNPKANHSAELSTNVYFMKFGAPVRVLSKEENELLPLYERQQSTDDNGVLISPAAFTKTFAPGKHISILKMDCEGCEYQLYDDTLLFDPDFFAKVYQFVVQVHLSRLWLRSHAELVGYGRLVSLLFDYGFKLRHTRIDHCNPKDEETGVLQDLIDIGYFKTGRGHCENHIFSK
jgi:hypothetical protein